MDTIINNNADDTSQLIHGSINEEILKKNAEILKLTTLLQDAERQCLSLDQSLSNTCLQYDSISEQLSKALEENFDLKHRLDNFEPKAAFIDHIMKQMQLNDLNAVANVIFTSIQEHYGWMERTAVNETESSKDLRLEIERLTSISNKQKQDLNNFVGITEKYTAIENHTHSLMNEIFDLKTELLKMNDLVEDKNKIISDLNLIIQQNNNGPLKSIESSEVLNQSVDELEIKYKKECLVLQKSLTTYKQTIDYKDKIIKDLEDQNSIYKNQLTCNQELASQKSLNISNLSTDNLKQEFDSLLIEQAVLNKENQDLQMSFSSLTKEYNKLKSEYKQLNDKHILLATNKNYSQQHEGHREGNSLDSTSHLNKLLSQLQTFKANEEILIEKLKLTELDIYQWKIKYDELLNYNQTIVQEINSLKQKKIIYLKEGENNDNMSSDLESWGISSEENKDSFLELKEVISFQQLLDGGLTNMIFLSCQNVTTVMKPYIQRGYLHLKRKAMRKQINSKMIIFAYIFLLHFYLLFFCVF